MSDNDNFDFPFPIPRRSRWDDAPPLVPNTLAEQRALRRAFEESYEAERELRQLAASLPRNGFNMPRSRARNIAAAAPTAAAETAAQEPKKLITTVVSMLPKTSYSEAETDEVGGRERTIAYVKVQRQLLKWLGTNAAETLSAHQARRWTQEIASDMKPTAQDALRLCYYMRSQTLDTYADVKGGCINLYVASQVTHARGPKTDKLYWKQNFTSNVIEYNAPSSRYAAAPGGRRNAFAPQAVIADLEGILGQLSGGQAAPPPPGFGPEGVADGWDDAELNEHAQEDADGAEEEADEDGDEGEDEEGDEQPAAGGGRGQPTREALAVLMAGAQADLEALLTSNHPHPTAVEVALAQLEEYRGQLDEA